jgi:hypoxanthine-guanine phosphoribosyltransferase
MNEFILLDSEDKEDYSPNRHINSYNSLHPSSKPLIINRHLDKALEEINILLYEDIIELWKIYGES